MRKKEEIYQVHQKFKNLIIFFYKNDKKPNIQPWKN